MTKLKDIAKHCGLSVTQVSRALNNHDDVSGQTKQKVLQAAKELGYVKNIVASNLANKTSNQVAIIIDGADNDTNEIPNNDVLNILRGANEYALEYGFELVVYMKNEDRGIDYVGFCKQRRISGLIIYGCHYDDKDFINLINSDFPSVAIDIMVEEKNKGCVIVNNTYYSQLVVNHLVHNGCKQIALISGKVHSHVTLERESGYRLALHSNGLKVNEALIVTADFELQMAKTKTIELLQKFDCIDGFYCMSDQMAIGCIEAIKSMGKRVPEDVKVFGFDGLPIGNYISPSLSSIKQDSREKGYCAAKLLAQIIAKENTEHTVVVPCEVVIRESSCLSKVETGIDDAER